MSGKKILWVLFLLIVGIAALVLSVHGWENGNTALLGGAVLLRAGWEIGKYADREPAEVDNRR